MRTPLPQTRPSSRGGRAEAVSKDACGTPFETRLAGAPQGDGGGYDLPYPSPVRRVEFDRLGDLALPAVAIGEQLCLVIVQLLASLGREFEVRPLDDGVHGA